VITRCSCGADFVPFQPDETVCPECADDIADAQKAVAELGAPVMPMHACKACLVVKKVYQDTGLCSDCLGRIRAADNKACNIFGIRSDMRSVGLCPGRSGR
jgi:hypothetical protein